MIEGQISRAAGARPKGRVAILADGENLSFREVESLMGRIEKLGDPIVLRAYCNRIDPKGWDRDHRFEVKYIDTVSGKNSADIRLVIDAMDIAHAQLVDAFVILSTDCDFAALSHRLRAFGHWVLGAGRTETSSRFRSACSEFYVFEQKVILPPEAAEPAEIGSSPVRKKVKPSEKIDVLLHAIIREDGVKGSFPIDQINAAVRKRSEIRISETAEKTWRAYLIKRPQFYSSDPKGPTARVRLVSP